MNKKQKKLGAKKKQSQLVVENKFLGLIGLLKEGQDVISKETLLLVNKTNYIVEKYVKMQIEILQLQDTVKTLLQKSIENEERIKKLEKDLEKKQIHMAFILILNCLILFLLII